MEKRNQPSENVPSSSPLDWLEYLALIGSVVGTAAVAAGQSIVLAATPLSLAVLVNFANRRRVDQLSLQNTRAARVQMQQISEQFQTFQQQLSNLPSGGSIPASSSTELQSLQASVGHLQHQYDGFQASISRLTEQLDQTSSGENLFGMENSISALSTSLRSYEGRLAALEQAPPAPGEGFASGIETADLGQLRTDLENSLNPIRQQIESLQVRVSDSGPMPSPDGLSSLESNLSGLTASLNSFGERLSHLEQTSPVANPESGSASANLEQLRSDLETMVTPVQEKLTALEARFSHLSDSTPDSSLDPSALAGLQSQMHQFNAQVETNLTELSQKVDQMPSTIQSVVQEQLQHQPQAESIDSLKQQIQSLEKRLEEVASQSASSAVSDDDMDFDALLSELA
jgi:chromosome segregation ATPase